MPHVLVAGAIHRSGLDLIEAAADFTYDYVEEVSEASYVPLLPAADALVIRTQPLSGATLARAERLRIVSRHGVGYDSVDVAALSARGLPLCVLGDVNSVSVAEHAMMLLLAAAKRLGRAAQAVRGPGWSWRNRLEPVELQGKRLLVIGYGRSGRHLARMARGFAMTVRAYDPPLARAGWPEGDVPEVADLAAGLAWADCISIHAPRGAQPILGAAELEAIKPGVIVVNTARGGALDEAALVAALAEGRVAAAGLDVFEDEPLPPDHPFLGMDQVVLTPHIAGLTAECGARMAVGSVQNVLDFFAGRLDPACVVDKNVL